MDLKIILMLALLVMSINADSRVFYTPKEYLQNYALSTCLARAYKYVKLVNKDAIAAARGYLELGDHHIDAYPEVTKLALVFLNKTYQSKQSNNPLTIMKCIDLMHSPELEALQKKYR